MTLDADTTRRLALIRLLLDRAVEMSRQSPPYSFDSINRLHDAAEMFLALAAQHHKASLPNEFMRYWDGIEAATHTPLSYRAQMTRFNKLRVNLKHYGVEPSPREIESAAVNVAAFIEDECAQLFGLRLDQISLANLIRFAEARRLLEESELAWTRGDALTALGRIAESFDGLIRDYEKRKMVGFRASVFDSVRDMSSNSPFMRGLSGTKQGQFEDGIIASLKALDFTLMLVGFGVDLRRYGRFKSLTPQVQHYADGGTAYYAPEEISATRQHDYEFARDFVIATAIHLGEFDYDLEPGSRYIHTTFRGRGLDASTDDA